jgi:hypothetical protein
MTKENKNMKGSPYKQSDKNPKNARKGAKSDKSVANGEFGSRKNLGKKSGGSSERELSASEQTAHHGRSEARTRSQADLSGSTHFSEEGNKIRTRSGGVANQNSERSGGTPRDRRSSRQRAMETITSSNINPDDFDADDGENSVVSNNSLGEDD